jgi:hypothetical protein
VFKLEWLAQRHAPRLALLVGALVWCALTGVFGLGRGAEAGFLGGGFDFQFLYYAGRVWASGKSPYLFENFRAAWDATDPFAYFPTVAPLSLGLASFPVGAAEVAMLLLNLAALVTLVVCGVGLVFEDPRSSRERMLVATATLALLSPFVSHVLWMGQTSLLATAFIVSAAYLRDRTPLVAGLLAAASTFKPQVSVLVVCWLLLQGTRRTWLGFMAGLALLLLPPVLVSGPRGLVLEWLGAVRSYQAGHVQDVAFRHVFGLRSVLATAGLWAPSLAPLSLLALASTRWMPPRLVPAYLLGASVLLIYSHDYDLVALIPAIPAMWSCAGRWQSRRGALLALAAFFLLSVPQRLLRPFDASLLLRYREVVVLALVIVLGVRAWQTSRRPDGAAL